MKGRAGIAAALIASVVVLAAEVPQPPVRSGQTFRSGTSVVMVDVSVRDRGRAVTGLTAGDFTVTDNGVRQQIDSVEATSVPIDLTLVLDVSGDPRAAWTLPLTPAAVGQIVGTEVAPIVALLRPTDRLRLLASDTKVQQIVPMGEVGPLPPLRIEGGGLSSLYDALASALLQPVEPARRHVVIARTKGLDTISSIDAAAVREVAERSDALLHVVMMETAFDSESVLAGFQCRNMGFCWPNRTVWVPHRRQLLGPAPFHPLLRDGLALEAGAQATGGAVHKAQLLDEPTLAGTFRKAFEDFRSSYVLRYTLQGVPRAGWHTIEVSVPGRRGLTVRARRGYLIETTAAPPPLPPLPEQLKSVSDFTAAYERGAFRQVSSSMRQLANPADLLRDFQDAGNPWPGKPQREAALILEIAEPGLFSANRELRQASLDAIDRFSRLIRHPLEPDLFERYWQFALLSTLEGTLRPPLASAYVDRALERFPDEPRFVLSRAIVRDQQWATRASGALRDAALPTGEQIGWIRRDYEAALGLPSIAAEARIRYAWFLHRIGRHDEALAQLQAAPQPIQDVSLRYLHHLFLGYVNAALAQHDVSLAHFKSALTTLPGAQSARVALMNALLLRGETIEAEALAQQVQTETGNEMDPWWLYWQGQYRLQPAAMARIRELSR